MKDMWQEFITPSPPISNEEYAKRLEEGFKLMLKRERENPYHQPPMILVGSAKEAKEWEKMLTIGYEKYYEQKQNQPQTKA